MSVVDEQETQIEIAAKAAHEVNRIYCEAIGDQPSPSWEDCPEWQRTSIRNGVRGIIHGNSPEETHRMWLAEKENTGWKYGPEKDVERKLHPCMRPYSELPMAQRMKDTIFYTVIWSVLGALTDGERMRGKVIGSC